MKRHYPDQPLVGVGAVVIKDDEILLIKRSKPPAEGFWSIPGGAVELGETLAEAVRREIKEECNIDIEPGPPIAVLDSITRDDQQRVAFHYTLIDFWATAQGGELHCSSDAKEALWVPLAEVGSLGVTGGLVALLDHLGCTDGRAPKEPPQGIFYYPRLYPR